MHSVRSKVKLNEKSDKMSLNAINTSHCSVPRSCMCICFLSVSSIGSLLFCGFEIATDTHLQVCFIMSVKIITYTIGFIVWHPNLFIIFFSVICRRSKNLCCWVGYLFIFLSFLVCLKEKQYWKNTNSYKIYLECWFNLILFLTCEMETFKCKQ